MFPTHVGIARKMAVDGMPNTDVPYACGDCADPVDVAPDRRACSLRMWGLRGSLDDRMRAIQMFPTHVGIAREIPEPRAQRDHVPYACGDCAQILTALTAPTPCSLRMWGLRDALRTQAAWKCMFPTHVGIARVPASLRDATGDVPYACGDCATITGPRAAPRRCSLRMWGLRASVGGLTLVAGMFPTHVGIARTGSLRGVRRTYVPYACGDCADSVGGRAPEPECSLRMWGLRMDMRYRTQAVPMFPTHVGIARARVAGRYGARDVPYACGDCAAAAEVTLGTTGCSLRMWGLREHGARRTLHQGMFPTHVGIARGPSLPSV